MSSAATVFVSSFVDARLHVSAASQVSLVLRRLLFRLFSSGLFGLFLLLARLARRGFRRVSGLSAAVSGRGVFSILCFAEARFARLGRRRSAFGSSGDVSVFVFAEASASTASVSRRCRRGAFGVSTGAVASFGSSGVSTFVSAAASTVPSSFLEARFARRGRFGVVLDSFVSDSACTASSWAALVSASSAIWTSSTASAERVRLERQRSIVPSAPTCSCRCFCSIFICSIGLRATPSATTCACFISGCVHYAFCETMYSLPPYSRYGTVADSVPL